MKFTCRVEIQAPRSKVVSYFKNPDLLGEWQDGFLGKELLEGQDWEVGAVSNMSYDFKGKPMIIQETILQNDLPDLFQGLYEHKHMVNTMESRFQELDAANTSYEAEIHYTEFRGFMVKVMATLFPGMFKKQVQKWLDQFKSYVEAH